MVEASAAVERRKASASRWTRGRARSASGWQHPMRGEAPRDSCAFSALRLPLFFWRQKIGGFGRQNPDADCVAGMRALAPSAPATAGEGDHWSSRSERTVVEGAPELELRFLCKRFSLQEEASEHVWTSRRLLRRVESCAPSTALRAVPLPRFAGAEGGVTSSASAWRCRSGFWLCLRRRAARCASTPAPAGS